MRKVLDASAGDLNGDGATSNGIRASIANVLLKINHL